MSVLRKRFGLQVQKLRKATGMTQEQLADHIDLTVESVSSIERGVYAPRFDTLEKISMALNKPLKDLFDFDD